MKKENLESALEQDLDALLLKHKDKIPSGVMGIVMLQHAISWCCALAEKNGNLSTLRKDLKLLVDSMVDTVEEMDG